MKRFAVTAAPAIMTTILVVATLFPIYWALVASLTPENRLFDAPSLLPDTLVADHYRALFATRDFWTPIRNAGSPAGMKSQALSAT